MYYIFSLPGTLLHWDFRVRKKNSINMEAFYNIYFSRCKDVFQLSRIGKKVLLFSLFVWKEFSRLSFLNLRWRLFN